MVAIVTFCLLFSYFIFDSSGEFEIGIVRIEVEVLFEKQMIYLECVGLVRASTARLVPKGITFIWVAQEVRQNIYFRLHFGRDGGGTGVKDDNISQGVCTPGRDGWVAVLTADRCGGSGHFHAWGILGNG
jgi:hypothetical protein